MHLPLMFIGPMALNEMKDNRTRIPLLLKICHFYWKFLIHFSIKKGRVLVYCDSVSLSNCESLLPFLE